MSKSKRYYWLKLKEDFFNDVRMKRLRKISGEETYTIIYLKLLLLSLKNDGTLYFQHVDETFTKELALVLDETEDDIGIALNYLLKVNLIETAVEDEYFMTEIPNLIGSETEWAKKKRVYREQLKADNVLEQSSLCLPQVRQEIEIEKEIEIEQEKEGEGEKDNATLALPTLNAYGKFKNVRLSDKDYEELQEVFGSQVTEKLIICPHTWKEQYLSPYPIL
ncbi:MAG: phage replisome organizer N-terminal domain-containing protein [Bacillota bacterium]|jgi:predicted phage replisome organizer|nr:phage replisome organizer N-terminal domain-containing protein [Bacillota bacterium]NLL26729.1 replisome organizer [Erysipelotrichia bacterium]